MYVKLMYKFEDMTDVLNGMFVEEMTDLLGSSTSGKGITIYEVVVLRAKVEHLRASMDRGG